eukprot:403343543
MNLSSCRTQAKSNEMEKQLNNGQNQRSQAIQQTAASTNFQSPVMNQIQLDLQSPIIDSSQTPIQNYINHERNPQIQQTQQQIDKPPKSNQSKDLKNLINLENVLLIEDKLWTILESFRYLQHQGQGTRISQLNQDQIIATTAKKQGDIALLCEEWWEITHEDNLNYLDRLFKDPIVRRSVRQSIILELFSITICYAITSEKSSDTESLLTVSTLTNLKNLLFYTHQNFLVLIDVIIHRLPPESSHNIWAHSLELLFSLLEKFTTGLLQKQNQIINQKSNIVDNQDENDYLPVVYPPYLPPLSLRQQDKTYTLVLDLDETLIHYFEMGAEGGHFLVRPGAERFLKEMATLYEVVIFTAAMQDYADWVLDQLDPVGHIKYRLYRQHATQTGPVFIKDLSKLGRDVSRVIIVDNVAENFQLQPDNGIFIRSWFDDMTDTALEELGPLLKEIVRKQVPDVRIALRRFRDQMIEQLENGITNPIMSLD